MIALKWLASAAVAGVTAAAIYALVVVPNRLNIEERVISERTKAIQNEDPMAIAPIAREHVRKLTQMLRWLPTDTDLHMLLAANYELLQLREEAKATYEQALAVDGRPEIYIELGRIQLALGNYDAAVTSFARAVRFQPNMIERVSGESLQEDVQRVVERMR